MKSYRNAGAALVLSLLLSTSAVAGEIHTGVVTPPPSPTANGVIQTGATDGVIQTGEAASSPEATDTLTQIVLNLLQSLLPLF